MQREYDPDEAVASEVTGTSSPEADGASDTPPGSGAPALSNSRDSNDSITPAHIEDDTQDAVSSGSDTLDPDTAWQKEKRRLLLTHLSSEPPDVEALRAQAVSRGGLLDDALRRRVWPLLLCADDRADSPPDPAAPLMSGEEVRAHPYHRQVVLDVERTLKRFPPGIEDAVRFGMQESLVTLIVRSLAAHPELHYYQGYHDVAITVLLVCGEPLAQEVLCALADRHLRVFMAPSMDETRDLLTYVLPLLEARDPPVCEFLLRSEAMATFALSWLITWFSHVLPEFSLITRLFDYVLATSWLAPVYLTAAVVLHRRDELLAGECDLAAVHSLLADIPDHLPWEDLLQSASRLLHDLPPDQLKPRVDALNRARRQSEEEDRERMRRRRAALQRRRIVESWVPPRHWTAVGLAVSVALLAGAVHLWRTRMD